MSEIEKIIRKQKIVNADCLEYLKSMVNESVDVIVTSPPYNFGLNNLYYKDNKDYQEYLSWLDSIFIELKRVSKNNSSFFLNVAGSCRQPYVPFDVLLVARKHFVLQNNIVWIKSVSIPDGNSWKSVGHFKPIRGERFINKQHESIFHMSKDGSTKIDRLAIGVPYEEKYNLKRWEHDSYCGEPEVDVRCRGNVWYLGENQITEIDLTWIAAMVDGEGCIYINKNNNAVKNGGSPSYGVRLEIANTNKKIIDRVYDLLKIGIIQERIKKGKRTAYVWHVATQQASEILNLIYPFLIGKKKEAEIALSLQKVIDSNSGYKKKLSEEELDVREKHWKSLKNIHNGDENAGNWLNFSDITSDIWFIPYETTKNKKKNPKSFSAKSRSGRVY